jgi:alpha-L-rhamnosidase
MVAWVDYLERTNPRYIRENELGNNYGDWLCIPADTTFRTHSPMKTLLATAYWADDAAKLARMARALGKDHEGGRFERMFAKVRQAFQDEWLREGGRLAVETQTATLLALAFDLLPEAVRAKAAEHLVGQIKALDWHLSTGFIGISHLNPILTATDHIDVAYRLLLNEDYPSWLYPVRHGATTIWERWNGWTEEEGFFNPHMNSFNHYSLGSVGEWLYRSVAGIELDPEINGFSRFQIKPCPGGNLTHAEASYRSVYGLIRSCWRREGQEMTLAITVPANTRATVHVPSDPDSAVREGDVPAEQADGIRGKGREGCFAVFEVPSGRYAFKSTFSE